AIRHIVDASVAVVSVLPKVPNPDVHDAALARPAYDAFREAGLDHGGGNRDDIDRPNSIRPPGSGPKPHAPDTALPARTNWGLRPIAYGLTRSNQSPPPAGQSR